jgi:small subunit ribosomal protein S21
LQPKYKKNLTKKVGVNMLVINIKENESIDKALKRFKKKFEKTGVLRQLRQRQAFEKPSITRRTQVIRAAYKQKITEGEEF